MISASNDWFYHKDASFIAKVNGLFMQIIRQFV